MLLFSSPTELSHYSPYPETFLPNKSLSHFHIFSLCGCKSLSFITFFPKWEWLVIFLRKCYLSVATPLKKMTTPSPITINWQWFLRDRWNCMSFSLIHSEMLRGPIMYKSCTIAVVMSPHECNDYITQLYYGS